MIKYYFLAAMLCAAILVPTTNIPQKKFAYKPLPTSSPEKPERERRDDAVTPFLRVSVGTEGSYSCSATIVYYSESTSTAYAIGCGHCYRGKNDKLNVITYFVGNQREVKKFKAKIVGLNQANDLSLITFQPDFVPDWVPIGTKDSPFFQPSKAPAGERVVVTGRDGGVSNGDRRPAAYEAFIREDSNDFYLDSRQSQSSGGRSGGGVMTVNRQWLIGVNHGRGTTVDAIGHGLWMPLSRIHEFLAGNGYGWLTEVGDIPRQIPVANFDTPTGYIPAYESDPVYVPQDNEN